MSFLRHLSHRCRNTQSKRGSPREDRDGPSNDNDDRKRNQLVHHGQNGHLQPHHRDGETTPSARPQAHHLAHRIREIKDYQLTHGKLLKVLPLDFPTRCHSINLGVSASPTPFPQHLFTQALHLQELMNELYMRVASDSDWLGTVLGPLLEHDDMLRTLWDINCKVREAKGGSEVSCGIFRSDYMLQQPEAGQEVSLKQVEMNTFSCAGACHAEKVVGMHRHLARMGDAERPLVEAVLPSLPPLPINTASITHTLTAAYKAYQPHNIPSRKPCILIPIQPHNFNVADELPFVHALWNVGLPTYRCEWQDLLSLTTLTPELNLLYHPPNSTGTGREVAIIFYRAGYDAAEYASKAGKATRLRLEMSRAIKCPDVRGHLAGMKAVQQALAQPRMLELFLQDSEDIAKLRATFMSMQPLSTPSATALQITQAPQEAEHYVLKANREGGGHNIYGAEIPAFLASLPSKQEWSRYILMRLIEPPKDINGLLLLDEEVYEGPVVSELGVLGGAVWRSCQEGRGVEVLENEGLGWTFKSKPWDVKGMNVVRGVGGFDCPLLVE